jgi:hypothetical protein
MAAPTMTTEKRHNKRRPLRRSVWVALGPDNLHPCILSDISDIGARLEVDETQPIPDHFMLFLSNNGAARRSCEVVWRQARQIGVKFGSRRTGTVSVKNESQPGEPLPETRQDELAFQNHEDVIARTKPDAVVPVVLADDVVKQ